MTASPDIAETEQRPRRGGRVAFVIWLLLTLALAALAGWAWWALQNRPPVVVEVMGETPPRLELDADAKAEVARLAELGELRSRQLRETVDSIDPPVCEAPKELDVGRFTALRKREDGAFTEWRRVLNAPAPPTSSLEDAPAPAVNKRATPEPASVETPAAPGKPGEQRPLSALSETLEQATVFVLGVSAPPNKGLGTGTGFFIGTDLIVTNAHVVDPLDPNRIFVTNRRLGGMKKAKLVARSPGLAPGMPDFALLRVEGATAPATLPLTPQRGKLTPVIAAGYPGNSLMSDEAFQRLLRGDLSAAPDLNMNRGEVRSVRKLGAITQVIHTADVVKGYSGGPLIDHCGRVLGVNTFISVDKTQASKTNTALAVDDLRLFLSTVGGGVQVDETACGG